MIPLFEMAIRHPDDVAIVTPDTVITYRQYLCAIINASIRLYIAGIRHSDRVAVLAPTSPEYIILTMALWLLRAVMVPLNTRWPERDIKRSLRDICSARLIVSYETASTVSFEDTLFMEDMVLPTWTDDKKGCKQLFCCKHANSECNNKKPSLSSKMSIRSLYSVMPPCFEASVGFFDDIKTLSFSCDQDATIIFTSGSSGKQKAVLHSLGNHYYSALGSNVNISLTAGDRWGLVLPLYHVGGLAIPVRALLSGAAVAIPYKGMTIPDAIRHMNITHISMVPTQLIRIMDSNAPSYLSGMKAVLLGGDSVPADLIARATENRIPLVTSYGSTEMTSQITATMPRDSISHVFTSGKLLPYRQLMISDDGEILVRGATLFKGYVNGRKTIKTGDGRWFHTGDLGFLDKDGYLTVTGRKDNMFISGGENIQPEHIEREILKLDGVAQAIVVSVEDYEYGNRPAAFVMMKDNVALDPVKITGGLAGRLPKFMIPVGIYPWPDEFEQKGIKINRQYFQKLARKLSSLSANK